MRLASTTILIMAVSFLFASDPTGEALPGEPRTGDKEILLSLLPQEAEIPQLKGRGSPEFYEDRNLFDYMNGQADAYLDYGFTLLIAQEYTAGAGSAITLEIHKMESPRHAFGIYAAERTTEDKAVSIGVDGFLGANMLGFWKGPYYCKILFYQKSPELDSILQKTGRAVADKIPGQYSPPELFDVFPSEHRIKGSERFIPKNFLGQPYLKNGYRADFNRGGTGYQVFLLETGSKEEAQASCRRYQEFLRAEGESVSPLERGEIGMVQARGERDKFLFQHGSFWGGVLDQKDPNEAEQTIRTMVERLKKKGH